MVLVRGGIKVKPHVQKAADALVAEFGPGLAPGTYNGHSPPEGPTQALDLFNATTSAGWDLQRRVADWLIQNAKRYGVRYVIKWNPNGNDWIWNIERAAEGWRAMATRDHKDHVHVTFYASSLFVEDEPTKPVPLQKEREVSKVAYPLQVNAGEHRKLPILAIGGGFGWKKASVTFASTGVEVRKAIVGPNVRGIQHLSPEAGASGKRFDGRSYVDLQAGDEWVEVELGTGEGDGVLDLYVEAAD